MTTTTLPNLWRIRCARCTIETPCPSCAQQIAAEHAYMAETGTTDPSATPNETNRRRARLDDLAAEHDRRRAADRLTDAAIRAANILDAYDRTGIRLADVLEDLAAYAAANGYDFPYLATIAGYRVTHRRDCAGLDRTPFDDRPSPTR